MDNRSTVKPRLHIVKTPPSRAKQVWKPIRRPREAVKACFACIAYVCARMPIMLTTCIHAFTTNKFSVPPSDFSFRIQFSYRRMAGSRLTNLLPYGCICLHNCKFAFTFAFTDRAM
jgi:hypothetical protein